MGRPYNSQNVFDNLHSAVPKSRVQVFLDTLSISGQLLCKEYGKIKVYLAAQTGAGNSEEQKAEVSALNEAAEEAVSAREAFKQKVQETRATAATLRGRQTAAAEAEAAGQEAAALTARLQEVQASNKGEEMPLDGQELADAEEVHDAAHA